MKIRTLFVKGLQKRPPESKGINLFEQELGNVVVVFQYVDEENLKNVAEFVNSLKMRNKKVVVFCYISKKESCEELLQSYNCFRSSDFSFFLKPKTRLKKMLDTQVYDLLIDLSDCNCTETRLLVGYMKAKIKIGQHDGRQMADYDIVIGNIDKKNTKELIENINHYLKIV